MNENGTGRCGHEDCNLELEDGEAVRRAGSNTRFCTSEHLLADANGKNLDEDGGVIEPKLEAEQ
ncbi:hypothetical protein [Natronorubrum halophilum]|uniref:hypothetical protein n=1 Tax=Natronorubrum halophilum TaxID=1702106 RepID=UPI000EF66080|nr:hypothetical protein [Natronorubrum halophilum]